MSFVACFLLYFSFLSYSQGSHSAVSCHVFLVSFDLEQSPSQPFGSLMPLTFLKIQTSCFPESSTIWIFQMVRFSLNILNMNTGQMILLPSWCINNWCSFPLSYALCWTSWGGFFSWPLLTQLSFTESSLCSCNYPRFPFVHCSIQISSLTTNVF